jgi:signal peptidase I
MQQIKLVLKIIVIGFIVFLITHFFIQLCFVNGNSMQPTLNSGNIIIIKKFDLSIKNNDIVVIRKNKKTLIKRVVGIPNDKIIIKDDTLYVNDLKFDNRITSYSGNAKEEITLADDEYYVLGDNRSNSIDSRYEEIGIIKKDEIIGIMLFNK